MSMFPEAEGWWYATDCRWYPPEDETRFTVTAVGSQRVQVLRALLSAIGGLVVGLGLGMVVDDGGLAAATQTEAAYSQLAGTIEDVGLPVADAAAPDPTTSPAGTLPGVVPTDPAAPVAPAAPAIEPDAGAPAGAPAAAPTEASCLEALATPEISAPFQACSTEQYARLQPVYSPGKPSILAACTFAYMGPACDPIPTTTVPTPGP